MQLKLNQVYQAESVLKKITNQEMPIKLAYRIQKSVGQLRTEYLRIEDLRMNLVKKYGEEENQKLQVKPDQVQAFVQEFGELLQEETEIDVTPIKIEDLPDTIKLSPLEVELLGFLLVE